eukprot:jgi/Tetstr1/466267/TSEL_000947.t1
MGRGGGGAGRPSPGALVVEKLWEHEGHIFLALLGVGLAAVLADVFMSRREKDLVSTNIVTIATIISSTTLTIITIITIIPTNTASISIRITITTTPIINLTTTTITISTTIISTIRTTIIVAMKHHVHSHHHRSTIPIIITIITTSIIPIISINTIPITATNAIAITATNTAIPSPVTITITVTVTLTVIISIIIVTIAIIIIITIFTTMAIVTITTTVTVINITIIIPIPIPFPISIPIINTAVAMQHHDYHHTMISMLPKTVTYSCFTLIGADGKDIRIYWRYYELHHSHLVRSSAQASLTHAQASHTYWEDLRQRSSRLHAEREAGRQEAAAAEERQRRRLQQAAARHGECGAHKQGRPPLPLWVYWHLLERWHAHRVDRLQADMTAQRCMLDDLQRSGALWASPPTGRPKTALNTASFPKTMQRHAALCEAEAVRVRQAERRSQLWRGHRTREVAWAVECAPGGTVATRVILRLWRPKWASALLWRLSSEDPDDFRFIEDIENADDDDEEEDMEATMDEQAG